MLVLDSDEVAHMNSKVYIDNTLIQPIDESIMYNRF